MERVGARLHVQADDAAEAVSVLGVDAVLRDGDLVHRVDGGRVGGLVAGAQRDAIEQHVVGAARPAARIVIVGVGVVVRPVLVGERHVDRGIEVGQAVGIAAVDRHLVDELPLDREIGVARLELHRHRRRFDDDALLEAADLEREIRGNTPALRHADVSLLRGFESLELAGDRIDARVDEIEDVVAVPVSHERHGDAGRVVLHRDGGARQRALGRVEHRALDATAIVLGAGRRRGEQQVTDERDPEHRWPHGSSDDGAEAQRNSKRLDAYQARICMRMSRVLQGETSLFVFPPDGKQGVRASDIHDALRQGRRGHQRFAHRVRGKVFEGRARFDDEHLAVFIRQVDLSVRRDG